MDVIGNRYSTGLQTWAVIGTGTISGSVVPDIMACSGAEVAVVHSRDASKAAAFAASHGIPGSTGDFDTVLADPTIDALYLATPFATHYDYTRRAIQAGKHVLVEKPMATCAREVAELFALAQRHGVFLMEGMWMKFNPAFTRLEAEIESGRIGEVRSIRAAFALPFPQDGGSRWDLSRSGGTLLDQGIYPVTLAHSLFGPPVEVHARGAVRDDGLDLAEHFTLEFSEGRYAQCASAMTEFTDRTASIGGTRGIITLQSPFWATTSLEIRADDYEKIFVAPEVVTLPREGNGYVPMVREVIAAIGAGILQHPRHDADATLAVFHTIDQILAQVRATRP